MIDYLKIPYEIRIHNISPLAILSKGKMAIDGVVLEEANAPYFSKFGDQYLTENELSFLIDLGLVSFKREHLQNHALSVLEDFQNYDEKYKTKEKLDAIKQLILLSA